MNYEVRTVGVVLALLTAPASAAVLTVPPGGSVQQTVNQAAPGDTVVVQAGLYNEGVGISIDNLTIQGEPGAIMDGSGLGVNGGAFYNQRAIRGLTIQGFEIRNYMGSGVYMGAVSTADACSDLVFRDLIIHDSGGTPLTSNGYGFYLRFSTNVLIENCEMFRLNFHAISPNQCRDVTIRNCSMSAGGGDGILGSADGDFIIEGNRIFDYVGIAGEHSDGMQILGWSGRLIIRNNYVSRCTQHIFIEPLGPSGEVLIYNNIVDGKEGWYNGIVFRTDRATVQSVDIFNNTLVRLNAGSGGIRINDEGQTNPRVRIINNIFYQSVNNAMAGSGSIDFQMNYNLYFNTERVSYIAEGSDLAGAQASGLEVNGLFADPLFTALAQEDYRLEAASPAIDSGVEIAPMGGVSFDSDFEGTARPQLAAWDIGALEATGGANPVPRVGTPLITPGGGTYQLVQRVALTSSTPAAQIHYTLDGTVPTENSPLYDPVGGLVLLQFTGTVRARGFRDGFLASNVAAAEFVDISGQDDPSDVEIINPEAGAVVGGVVAITALASDSFGVAGVEFRLDGQPLGAEDLLAPYEFQWSTFSTPNGPYVLTAVARDSAGNFTESEQVTVAVFNFPALGPALVAAYGFEAGLGTTICDGSIFSNHGSIEGPIWAAQGRFGNALAFDGVDDLVTVRDAPSLDLIEGMTIALWVFPTAPLLSWRTVVTKELGNAVAYWLAIHSPSDLPAAGASIGFSDQIVLGDTKVPIDRWTHLAATYDGDNLRYYVNGLQVTSRSVFGSIATSDDPLRLGGNDPFGEHFTGLLDEIRIYNYARSAPEIQADMTTPVGPCIVFNVARSWPFYE